MEICLYPHWIKRLAVLRGNFFCGCVCLLHRNRGIAADVGRSFEVEEGAGAGGARSMALLRLLRGRLGLYGFRRKDY